MPETLKGELSCDQNLSGTLTEIGNLTGTINASSVNDFEQFSGPYEMVPTAFSPQVLDTQNKILLDNITIKEIPFYETSNLSDGITAYIGKGIENGV